MTDVTLRSIAPSAYLPTLLYGIGQGAIAPVVALSALELGASAGQASLVVALAGIGQVTGDVPAGWLTARFGERATMLGASLLVAAALAACARVGSEAAIDAARVFRQFLEPIVPMIDAPEPEVRLDVVYRLIYGTCQNRVLYGELFESGRPLTWRQLTDELVNVSCLYLLGAPAR